MHDPSEKQWQPVPLPAPEPRRQPPPDQDPSKKPELGDEPNERDGRRGSMVINGTDDRDDDRLSDKIKRDDEL